MYPATLKKLIATVSKLPGVGKKSAERYVFDLLSWKQEELHDFGKTLETLKQTITSCKTCGALSEEIHCRYCDESKRNKEQFCVVAMPKDIYAIESTGVYNGMYHVLEGLLSPIDGKHPEDLKLDTLKLRILQLGVKEVVLALDPTLEGDATSLYLKKMLEDMGIAVSKLALGLPVGSSLDYVDEGTLSLAFNGRLKY